MVARFVWFIALDCPVDLYAGCYPTILTCFDYTLVLLKYSEVMLLALPDILCALVSARLQMVAQGRFRWFIPYMVHRFTGSCVCSSSLPSV